MTTATKSDPIQSAIDKAQRVSPKVIFLGTLDGESGWKVAGSGRLSYYRVFQTAEGCTCECKAGQEGRICYHRAAVLLNKLANDAADPFLAALDASIESQRIAQEDARLQAIVGEWWTKHHAPQKEQPMQQPCKSECGRAAGPTGLCQPCLMVQEALRKSAARKDHDVSGSRLGADCYNGHHADCMRRNCTCACHRKAQTCTRMESQWDNDRVFDPISGWKSAS